MASEGERWWLLKYILPPSQNTNHSRNFRTDWQDGKMLIFISICYQYLIVIDSYMHMHFLNRVKWLAFWDKFWITEWLVFFYGGSMYLGLLPNGSYYGLINRKIWIHTKRNIRTSILNLPFHSAISTGSVYLPFPFSNGFRVCYDIMNSYLILHCWLENLITVMFGHENINSNPVALHYPHHKDYLIVQEMVLYFFSS